MENLNCCDTSSVPIADVLKKIDKYLKVKKLEDLFQQANKSIGNFSDSDIKRITNNLSDAIENLGMAFGINTKEKKADDNQNKVANKKSKTTSNNSNATTQEQSIEIKNAIDKFGKHVESLEDYIKKSQDNKQQLETSFPKLNSWLNTLKENRRIKLPITPQPYFLKNCDDFKKIISRTDHQKENIQYIKDSRDILATYNKFINSLTDLEYNINVLNNRQKFQERNNDFKIEIENLKDDLEKCTSKENIERVFRDNNLASSDLSSEYDKFKIKIENFNSNIKGILNDSDDIIKIKKEITKEIKKLEHGLQSIINDIKQFTLLENYNALLTIEEKIKKLETNKTKTETEELKTAIQNLDKNKYLKTIKEIKKNIDDLVLGFDDFYQQQTFVKENKVLLVRLLIITYFFDFTVEEIEEVINTIYVKQQVNNKQLLECLENIQDEKKEEIINIIEKCHKNGKESLSECVEKIYNSKENIQKTIEEYLENDELKESLSDCVKKIHKSKEDAKKIIEEYFKNDESKESLSESVEKIHKSKEDAKKIIEEYFSNKQSKQLINLIYKVLMESETDRAMRHFLSDTNNISDPDTLTECYKRLPTTLNVTIKQIFLEIDIQLRNMNLYFFTPCKNRYKGYQLSYIEDKSENTSEHKSIPKTPQLKLLSRKRDCDYLWLSALFACLILIWLFWFYCININNSYGLFDISRFTYTFIPIFYTMSLAGFFGMFLYYRMNKRINWHTKRKILKDINYSHLYKIKRNENHKIDETKILKSNDQLKQKYHTDTMYLSIDEHLQNLIRSVVGQDPVSKAISRKSKRLKHSIEKIEVMKDNQFVKTARLRFIADFMRELTLYAQNLNLHESRQVVSDRDIDIVEKNRNLINQIEAKISLNRAWNIFFFFFWFISIFFTANALLSNWESVVPLSLYLVIAVCVLLIPIGYLGYSLFKYVSIHKGVSVWIFFLIFATLLVIISIIFPYHVSVSIATLWLLYYVYSMIYGKRLLSFLMGWRQNSTKIEDSIANIYELALFFIATCILLGLYYKFSDVAFFELLYPSEDEFFYTIVSSFFPIEVFGEVAKNKSLLFNNSLADGFRYTIRFLSIVLTTTLFVKAIQLLTDKYRKYSYDEHSYNAFLPPELFKIFGYFIIFIVSTGISYALIVSEVKQVYEKGMIEDCRKSIQTCKQSFLGEKQCTTEKLCKHLIGSNDKTIALSRATSFGLADFLPYSIFLALVGAGFSLSTRELLENYFSGIAQRVDSFFEEDDMVKIGDSELMQVKAIGFKNVTFFDITQNAYRYISFKQLDAEKVVNFTEPTLHFRRNIELFVAKDQKFIASTPLMSNKPVILRAEMLLLLSAFYVDGVQVPTANNLTRIKEADVRRKLYKYKEGEGADGERKEGELIKQIKDFNKGMNEFKNEINNTNSDNYLINQPTFSNYLNDQHKAFLKILMGDIQEYTGNKDDYKLYLDSLKEVKGILANSRQQKNINRSKKGIKKLVDDLVRGVDIAKVLHTYIRYACEKHNVYIDYKQKKGEDKLPEGRVRNIDTLEAYPKEEKLNCLIKANDNYNQLLLTLADKAVEVSYLYYDIALSLWDMKDENRSKNEKRSLDSASLELLNVPRVTSHNLQEYDPIMWKMKLEVTLKLAEQSDEIIHHMNQFIDKNYVLFIGTSKENTSVK